MTIKPRPSANRNLATYNQAKAATYFIHTDWVGMERDAQTGESGLDNFGARSYSSNLVGKFMQPDPAGLASVNLWNPMSFYMYGYVLNNPLNATDPSGMVSCLLTNNSATGNVGVGGIGATDDVCMDPNTSAPSDNCTAIGASSGGVDCSGSSDSSNGDGSGGGQGNGNGSPTGSAPTSPGPFIIASMGGNAQSSGTAAPNNGPAPSPCQATLLNMANQQLGTNFNSSNISGSYTNGTAYNIIIQSNQLTSAQFNNIQQGRYTTSGWQYLTGAGLAGHIADETNLGFAQSAFQSSNVGGNLSVSFAFHDDHGYANNPIGALIHYFTDVRGHNTRKPC